MPVDIRSLRGALRVPIVVADVGARWGVSPAWAPLGEQCLTIGFEPDGEECRRLTAEHAGRSNVRFVEKALGPVSGFSTLYLTRGRGASSIYCPAEHAMRRHPALAEVLPVEDTCVIEMTTLDQWCKQEAVDGIDVVKVDTQGSELGVLQGAARMLATASAVEVEVEFNEIYSGAPLFGDVDRFLRAHGFVLWRLADLAHYPQAGAPTGWRNVETAHYVDHVASFPSGAGQVYWADAFYLKTATAYPEPAMGWERLVRDAVLTGALGFFDLTRLALDHAAADAPHEIRSLIQAAVGGAGEPVTSEETTPTLSETLRVQLGDTVVAGGGWQPVQRFGSVPARWTGPGRDAWVDLPVRLPAGTRVELLSVASMSPDIQRALAVHVNGVPVKLGRSPHPNGTLYSGRLPAGYGPTRQGTRVMVRTPNTVPSTDGHGAAGVVDAELGAAVAWLRFTPPGD